MTEPAKTAPAADKKDDHPKKKMTMGARLMMIGSVILLLLIFFFYTDATIPMMVQGLSATVRDTGKALSELGQSGRTMASGIRDTSIGLNASLIEILILLVKAGLTLWLISLVLGLFRKEKPAAEEHH